MTGIRGPHEEKTNRLVQTRRVNAQAGGGVAKIEEKEKDLSDGTQGVNEEHEGLHELHLSLLNLPSRPTENELGDAPEVYGLLMFEPLHQPTWGSQNYQSSV